MKQGRRSISLGGREAELLLDALVALQANWADDPYVTADDERRWQRVFAKVQALIVKDGEA